MSRGTFYKFTLAVLCTFALLAVSEQGTPSWWAGIIYAAAALAGAAYLLLDSARWKDHS